LGEVNMKTREELQQEAIDRLAKFGFNGTIVANTGFGKTRVGILAASKAQKKNVLVVSPRTAIAKEWNDELSKVHTDTRFTIYNIQTAYKWTLTELSQYDMLIVDEIHTAMTPEYGALIENMSHLGIPIIGLTGTPDNSKPDKAAMYARYCPIVYKYVDAAIDGIINKRRYIIFSYALSNNVFVKVTTAKKSWSTGELRQYEYLTDRVNEAKADMLPFTNGFDVLGTAFTLINNPEAPAEARKKAYAYVYAVKARKEFLNSLTSSLHYTRQILRMIEEKYPTAKTLVFSELISQAERIGVPTVHSKNPKEINIKRIQDFNEDRIKVLASCSSLAMGVNLKSPRFAIMESFNGSEVQASQKAGRTDRLPVHEVATIIYVVPQETQSENWLLNAVFNADSVDPAKVDIIKVESLNELQQVL